MGAGILKTKSLKTESTNSFQDQIDLESKARGEEQRQKTRERYPELSGLWAERDAKIAAEKLAAKKKAQEDELAPLKKSLTDEVDFLGKRFGFNSKIGGRGAL